MWSSARPQSAHSLNNREQFRCCLRTIVNNLGGSMDMCCVFFVTVRAIIRIILAGFPAPRSSTSRRPCPAPVVSAPRPFLGVLAMDSAAPAIGIRQERWAAILRARRAPSAAPKVFVRKRVGRKIQAERPLRELAAMLLVAALGRSGGGSAGARGAWSLGRRLSARPAERRQRPEDPRR